MSFTPVLLHDGQVPLQFGVDLIAFPRFVLTAIKRLTTPFFIYYGFDPPFVPCLCLCFGFSQMTITLLFLLIILHFSHIGLTDGLTFIIKSLTFNRAIFYNRPYNKSNLFRSPGYPAFVQVVNRNFDRDFVSRQNPNIIHS